MQNMRDFNSPFSSSWRLICAWAFLNWAFVFPSFSFKIDTSSSNHAVSSWACNNWNRIIKWLAWILWFSIYDFSCFERNQYRRLRMLCRCLPWMILLWMILPLDACSSLVKILQTAAVSFAVKCAMQVSKELGWCTSTLIFFPPRPFSISLSRKCCEQTFVISISLNFVPKSLRIFYSHWAQRFGSFGKLKKPTLFPLAFTVPLWLQTGTQQLIFELEFIPNKISSQETVALKKSLLDDR